MTMHLMKAIYAEPIDGMLNLRRTMALSENGFVVHEDFAGRQGFVQGLAILISDLQDSGLETDGIVIWRTTEKCAATRKLIAEGKLKPVHLIPTVEDAQLDEAGRNLCCRRSEAHRPSHADCQMEKMNAYTT